jgi:hypothetical protein
LIGVARQGDVLEEIYNLGKAGTVDSLAREASPQIRHTKKGMSIFNKGAGFFVLGRIAEQQLPVIHAKGLSFRENHTLLVRAG